MYPYGIVEDVVLQVDCFKFPVYFIILEIEDKYDTKLLLGRPFMTWSQHLKSKAERKKG